MSLTPIGDPPGQSIWGTRVVLEEVRHQWLVLIHNPDDTEYVMSQWTGVDITDGFEGPHTTIEINAMEPSLVYITELETDLLFFRNNVLLYRMRVIDSEDVFTRNEHLVRYECSSYEKLLERRLILTDWVLVDEDLDAAWKLIEYAQVPESLGITRDPLAVGGTMRQRTLDAGDTVYEAINDFAEADDGFDWWIDQYLVWHAQKPRRGDILGDEWQWGAEAAEISRQAPLEDYASFIMVTGASGETSIPDGSGGETVYPPPPPQFVELPVKNLGYWAKSISYSDVVTVASLAEKARFNLNDLANMRPTYSITLEPGIWNPGYRVGDVVYLRVSSPPRADFRVPVRIEELHITCSIDGEEVVEVSARAEESETLIDPNPGYAPNGRTMPRRRLRAWDDVAALLQDFDRRTGRLERTTITADPTPWGTSWGTIAETNGLNGPLTIAAGVSTNVTPSLIVTPVVGRRYRIGLVVRAIASTTNASGRFRISSDGANMETYWGDRYVQIMAGNAFNGFASEWHFQGDGLSHTFIANWLGSVGTVDMYPDKSPFWVEDVGPVAR